MVRESTQKQYDMRIRRLQEANINIRRPSDVFNWFEKEKLGASSQKVYISAIQQTLDKNTPSEYKDKLNELWGQVNRNEIEQKLSVKQQPNYLKWEDILQVQSEFPVPKTIAKWKQYLVISLYTLNAPVRADYGQMEVHTKYDKTRTENELIWNKNPRFIFRKYKTMGRYGEVEIPVSKPLQKVIADWFAFLGDTPEYLLNESIKQNTFAVYVANVFRQYTGKEIGVSMLRHSYITHTFPALKTLKQKEKVSKLLLHSVERMERYNLPYEDDE